MRPLINAMPSEPAIRHRAGNGTDPPHCRDLRRIPSGVMVRATHVGPVVAMPPVWTKRRHVDLCRTHTALCR